MEIDIPQALVKRLRKAYHRTYGVASKEMSNRAIVIALLSDSLHPIDDSYLTIK